MKRIYFILIQIILYGSALGSSLPYFTFDDNEHVPYAIRFEEINNLILLPLTINSSDTIYFILDSGAENTILFGSEFDHPPIDTNNLRSVKIAGLGDQESISAFVSANNKIKIGNVIGLNQDIVYIKNDYLHFSETIGRPIHGILGASIFHNFLIQVNYYNHKITFLPQDSPKIKKRRYSVLDLNTVNNRPYIKLDIEIHPRINLITNLLIDLGESKPLSLYLNSHELIFLPEPNYFANLGKGLTGIVTGRVGKISGLRLGKYYMDDVVTAFPDEEDIRHIVSIEDRNGSLGAGILKQFISVFDLKNNLLYLRRGSLIKNTFKFDKSGLVIIARGKNFDEFLITGVIEGTTAYRAGVKIGDIITAVNYENVEGKKIGDVLNLIEKGGRKFSLTINRNGEEKIYKLKIFKI